MAQKFKTGDSVIVITGSDKGKVGKISSIIDNRVVVEGVSISKVHKKPTNNNPGSIVKVEKPIHISNISHVENDKPVKVKFFTEQRDGKNFKRKFRISKKTGEKIK
ncbi:MAG: 50S ribosomal protein L24 [Rickettsiales bacterium]|nr:50S ribosomal protein L24 [Rickettsiales bacterium]